MTFKLHFRRLALPWMFLPAALLAADVVQLAPAQMPRITKVDERFQSYNVEMVEVTGGRFWAPYKKKPATAAEAPAPRPAVAGLDPSLFMQRSPIELANPRLLKLAAALGPAYIRVSGSWANSTYFHDADTPAPTTPPEGFGGVLTRAEWRAVMNFAKAVNGRVVTSFAVSPGVRDAGGIWTPVEAHKLAAYTKSIGGSIAAAEMFNEPNFAAMAGAPKGYTAETYGKDFAAFLGFAKKELPEMLILGPGSVGEAGGLSSFSGLKTEEILKASPRGIEAFSYHFYGAVSKRCGGMPGVPQAAPETALTAEWLGRTERDAAFYEALRDKYEPGKPMWLTETGETACGGNAWASTFVDSFRYLGQLGRLARRGVQVVMHNTLSASDYALIDEETLTPRPNYWAALLWAKVMGSTVLDAGARAPENTYVYAHCLRGTPGGVGVLALNANRESAVEVNLPAASERYTLTARELLGGEVELNGRPLKVSSAGDVPEPKGAKAAAGVQDLPPLSITFFAIPGAANAACR